MVAHHGRFVQYLRVSTTRQGDSGLGLDAQRKAVRDHFDGGGWKPVATFTEIEGGRRKTRPELAKAPAACKKRKAKLVIAKLDRLTHDTKFLLALLNSGVEVLFCDLPQLQMLVETDALFLIPAASAASWNRRLSWRVVIGLPGLRPGNSQRSWTGVVVSNPRRAFHHCRNRSSVSGDSITWRSLRLLDCSMRMIFCALSICLTFSRTTSPARNPQP